ncbi:hypothetical protein CHS0354_028605 [Potamilus streckersoni]|uniref:F5/8 type C domain-containing protein n=1 Tax=Potamilus streckersoni TaxID=2493646 RepID=A0AAE0S6K0_9BIVA|nr:hypothetical protein CHS0354_028605 [Potamilus streckersoni]
MPTDTIGKSCSSNQECHEQLSECREGLCLCLRNHSYSLTEYACVPRFLGRLHYLISGPDVIPNDHFKASSSFYDINDFHKPWWARLDSEETPLHCGCWAAQDINSEQYIQVNLKNAQFVTAVTTKGRDPKNVNQLVNLYKVMHSFDGLLYNPVRDHNGKELSN